LVARLTAHHSKEGGLREFVDKCLALIPFVSHPALGNKKPCLDSYSKVLKEEDVITKQDVKDITAWGGLRNHAAHGEWDEVADRTRISVMLEGVNLFLRKYGS
jgi:hypothetical protein